jgi:putative transposase
LGVTLLKECKTKKHVKKIKKIAMERPRFGYRRIYVVLRKNGLGINHKKLFRLYKEMGLKIRKRLKKKSLGTQDF